MNKSGTAVYPDVQEEKEFQRGVVSAEELLSWELSQVFEHYEVSPYQLLQVFRFLSDKAYLQPILLQAVSHIRRIFGQCPVYLEVVKDPNEGFEELFAVVMVSSTPEKAVASLNQFDEEWFTQVQTQCTLNFTVDIVKDETV